MVGEDNTIKTETLICVGKKVINKKSTSTNLHPEDISGVGKDFVTEKTSDVVFCKDWQHFDNPTPTAIVYGQRKKNLGKDNKGNDIWETEQDEITKDTIIHIKDAGESFLNGDNFKIMLEGDVDVSKNIEGHTHRIKFPKSVIIITTADTNTNFQILRRVPSLPFDSSTQQTNKIVKYQWKTSSDPRKLIQNTDWDSINVAKYSFYELKDVLVELPEPILEYAISKLPKCSKVIMRTLNQRLIDYIKFSSALHQYQRKNIGKTKWLGKTEYETIEATKQDVDIGYLIFENMYKTEFADVSLLNKRQRNIYKKLKESLEESFSVSEMRAWDEAEGVTAQQIYDDIVQIMRADKCIKVDENFYPKKFYYDGMPKIRPVEEKIKFDADM